MRLMLDEGGVEDFGQGTVVRLHGREAVLPESRAHAIDHVLALAASDVWAINPKFLPTIVAILTRRAGGVSAGGELAFTPQPKPSVMTGRGVAVIPLHGTIAPRANLVSDVSGMTTFEGLQRDVKEAVADPQVGTIILDVDSEGGMVMNAPETASVLRGARAHKPIWALSNFRMHSAAYWVASNATEIIASPSASVGSLGVYTIHDDLSKAFEQAGIKRTYLSVGPHKVDGNEAEPLSVEAKAQIDHLLAQRYDRFMRDVAEGRGVPESEVRERFTGEVKYAEDALALGMIDRIATLEETIARAQQVTAAPARVFAETAGAGVEARGVLRDTERFLFAWGFRPRRSTHHGHDRHA
jgi:signal peptide peptidase SppA